MKKSIILTALLALTAIVGCGDPVPTEYVPQPVVQGYLIVGEPMQGIRVMRSLSVTDTFRYENSGVTDADVKITANGHTYQLEYRPNSIGEYFFADSEVLVQPTTRYDLTVTLKDGTTMTGTTFTPAQIAWVQAPKDTLRYPHEDSLNVVLPDSMKLIWNDVPNVEEYPISVRCLDTVEYGIYLGDESGNRNSRIDRDIDKDDPRYDDLSRWGFLQGTSTPISWFAFKWYGRHEVSIWAPDANFLKWFKFMQFGSNQQYNSQMGSIKGGAGVFGSASVARKEVFLLKERK